jgi:hypothetical protein
MRRASDPGDRGLRDGATSGGGDAPFRGRRSASAIVVRPVRDVHRSSNPLEDAS